MAHKGHTKSQPRKRKYHDKHDQGKKIPRIKQKRLNGNSDVAPVAHRTILFPNNGYCL